MFVGYFRFQLEGNERIIYGIKFVQKEFVNLIMGREIEHGDMAEEDVDGVQSVRLVQMLGFCQGKDDLVHNKELAAEFFSEGKNNGYFYTASLNKYFAFPSYTLWI
jgi:hypothetical protein